MAAKPGAQLRMICSENLDTRDRPQIYAFRPCAMNILGHSGNYRATQNHVKSDLINDNTNDWQFLQMIYYCRIYHEAEVEINILLVTSCNLSQRV